MLRELVYLSNVMSADLPSVCHRVLQVVNELPTKDKVDWNVVNNVTNRPVCILVHCVIVCVSNKSVRNRVMVHFIAWSDPTFSTVASLSPLLTSALQMVVCYVFSSFLNL